MLMCNGKVMYKTVNPGGFLLHFRIQRWVYEKRGIFNLIIKFGVLIRSRIFYFLLKNE
jgi:hypothetical protein